MIDSVSGHPAFIDPLALALTWLPTNDDPERPQITLSTIDAHGAPDARTVLLYRADADGFWFHTNIQSRKVAQLAVDPRVALTVLWPGFTRQLVVAAAARRAQHCRDCPAAAAPAGRRMGGVRRRASRWLRTNGCVDRVRRAAHPADILDGRCGGGQPPHRVRTRRGNLAAHVPGRLAAFGHDRHRRDSTVVNLLQCERGGAQGRGVRG